MAVDLTEFKTQYPEVADIPDSTLLAAIHRKLYADKPWDEFVGSMTERFGFKPETGVEEVPRIPATTNLRVKPKRFTNIDEEEAFQGWYAQQAQILGLDPDPDSPLQYYDYRAAYKAGVTPDKDAHWPSEFKLPGHPTYYKKFPVITESATQATTQTQTIKYDPHAEQISKETIQGRPRLVKGVDNNYYSGGKKLTPHEADMFIVDRFLKEKVSPTASLLDIAESTYPGITEDVNVSELSTLEQMNYVSGAIGKEILSLPAIMTSIVESPLETIEHIPTFIKDQMTVLSGAAQGFPEYQEELAKHPVAPVFAAAMFSGGIRGMTKAYTYGSAIGRIAKEVIKSEKVFIPETVPKVVETPKLAEMPKGKPTEAAPSSLGLFATPEVLGELGADIVGVFRDMREFSDNTWRAIETNLMPPKEPGTLSGIEQMVKHHKAIRQFDNYADKLSHEVAKAFPVGERQWNMALALEQPKKYGDLLTAGEKAMVAFLREEQNKYSEFFIKNDIVHRRKLPEGAEYVFHHWLNEKTGKPEAAWYGKFSRTTPQAQRRKHLLFDEGLEAGKKPATVNPGALVGYSIKGGMRAYHTRQMFKSLNKVEAGIDGVVFETRGGKERPLRMIENWDELANQGLYDGYVKFEHNAFMRAVGKDFSGENIIFKGGRVGVREELYPFIRNYFESPSYGKLMRAAFVAKSLKLGLSMFHPFALGWQEVGAGQTPWVHAGKGLRILDKMDETTQLLVRNGLERKGYADVGTAGEYYSQKHGTLRFENKALDKALAPVRLGTAFIFDYLHPGIKTYFARTEWERLWPEYQRKGLSKDECARDIVKMSDRLFSGEDYKMAMLESSRFIANFYYSPKARKMWQFALISPTWQKAHLGMAREAVGSIMPASVRTKMGLVGATKPINKAYQKYFGRAIGIYAAANIYNFVMTKHMDGEGRMMFQNPGGNMFSVRAPWNEPDGTTAYFRPLKSIFEVPEFFHGMKEDIWKKSRYKLAPYIGATMGMVFNLDYRGKKYLDAGITAAPRMIADWMLDVGTPISIANVAPVDLIFDWDAAMKKKGIKSRMLSGLGIPISKGVSKGWFISEYAKAHIDNDWNRKFILQEMGKANGLKIERLIGIAKMEANKYK
jgi:hypothetical protein